jgi:NADH dehydrogenase/NADH:ubiquinone oxidoreductase subunit G
MSEALKMKENGKNLPHLVLDGEEVSFSPGETLYQLSERHGRKVPTLCFDPRLEAFGSCRLCVVEVEESRTLQPACVVPVREGMVVSTNSERVNTSRRVILELLASHVDLHDAPYIQKRIAQTGADVTRFAGGLKREFDVFEDNPFYIRDYSQCVMCWRCIQVCADDVQHTFALTWGKRGAASHVATFFDEDMPDTTCVFCGNCVGVCPTGALKGLTEWRLEHN